MLTVGSLCTGYGGLDMGRMSAPDAGRPTMPTDDAADHGTCDWGGCDARAETWRYDTEHSWLPVCGKCSRTTWDTTGPDGLPRRKR